MKLWPALVGLVLVGCQPAPSPKPSPGNVAAQAASDQTVRMVRELWLAVESGDQARVGSLVLPGSPAAKALESDMEALAKHKPSYVVSDVREAGDKVIHQMVVKSDDPAFTSYSATFTLEMGEGRRVQAIDVSNVNYEHTAEDPAKQGGL